MPKRNFRQHRPLYTNTLPKDVREPKIRWKILPVIWLAIKRAATALGFLVLINIVVALFVIPSLLPRKAAAPSLPDEMVLFLKFEDGFRERAQPPSFAEPFAVSKPNVRDIVYALDKAAADKRVKGVIARMYSGNFNLASASEVREAVKRFRAAGKFAHIYSSSYGEGAGGLGRYYLASAFEEIWMQPLGLVSITGVGAEIPFLRGTLDKIGIEPQFFQRKEYKNAYESLTSKSMSRENKETMQNIVNDVRFEILRSLPEERGMRSAEFESLVNKGLFTAEEAEKAGLITHMDYGDVLLDSVAERMTGKRDSDALDIVDFGSYAKLLKKREQGLGAIGKPKVALVYAVGAIMPSGDKSGFGGDGIAAADKIAPAIYKASKDDDVQAIILRIDSPGGSPGASESILRALEKAQERGKPVIVSMGATAASGGYWIAAYADKIFALPSTLTGSIGVVGGKFAMRELFAKLGINWEKVTWGRNAGLWSPNTRFNQSEAERIHAMLDNVYDNFVARVAKGRKMSVADVEKVAGGRVWTGRRALEAGLVDELGGLDKALDHVASLVGVQGRDDLNLVEYPKPQTPLEQILKLLEAQARMGQAASVHERFLEAAEPFLDVLNVYDHPQNFMTYEPLRIER